MMWCGTVWDGEFCVSVILAAFSYLSESSLHVTSGHSILVYRLYTRMDFLAVTFFLFPILFSVKALNALTFMSQVNI
jgi:hypothetical protein